MALARLSLTDFRSYALAEVAPGAGLVILTGENGAGKTNVLEAVSLLAPGRGLRGVPLGEMARAGGAGGFAVSAMVAEARLGTGALAVAPERRVTRINGAAASAAALGEWLSIVWLTPAQDRLFAGTPGDRRRFLDRLVLAFDPAHARHSARYEAAMRQRNRLLAEERADDDWLAALEAAMGEHGDAITSARLELITRLNAGTLGEARESFPQARIQLSNILRDALATRLAASRAGDAAAGRATHGPHTQDLLVDYIGKDQPAARCSTGEQKALLIGIVLAHADLVAERSGRRPVLLLDEVAAHLDARRRAALFGRLAEAGGQVWMTGTDAALFADAPGADRFAVADGRISRG